MHHKYHIEHPKYARRYEKMKNINDVMRQKELEIQQLQREIEALRVAARLLADDSDTEAPAARPAITNSAVPRPTPIVTKPADPVFAQSASGIRQFP